MQADENPQPPEEKPTEAEAEAKPNPVSPTSKDDEAEQLDQKEIDEALKQKYEIKADKRIKDLFIDKEHLAP